MGAAARMAHLDNLKVVLVAGIIAGHAILGYTDVFSWPYQELRETNLSPVTVSVLLVLVVPVAFFLIALLFLVSGLFTPGSLEHKGTAAFLRDRAWRLGVPWAVYAFVLWPTVVWALDRGVAGQDISWWQDFVGADPFLDTGPLWFLLVLLLFSAAYAGWVRLRAGAPTRRRADHGPGGRTVVGLVVAVAVTTFLVRLVFPLDSAQPGGLHLWQWPECVATFSLGILASRHGWQEAVPPGIRRGCLRVAAVCLVATMTLILVADQLGVRDQLAGGWSWPAAGVAVVGGTLTVCGPIVVLAWAQRHLRSSSVTWQRASRSAYAAFLLQGPVLVGLAVVLRPLPVVAEVKALLVLVGGVLGCFALGWVLVQRTALGRHL